MAQVLIGDDAAFVRKLMREILELAGHEVVEAANGEELVARFAELEPDVCVIDVNMPVLDGFAAAAAIRELNADARLIVASVYMSPAWMAQVTELGAHFLAKPFSAQELLDQVAALDVGAS